MIVGVGPASFPALHEYDPILATTPGANLYPMAHWTRQEPPDLIVEPDAQPLVLVPTSPLVSKLGSLHAAIEDNINKEMLLKFYYVIVFSTAIIFSL